MNKILLFLLFISFHSMASFSGHWVNESESQSLTLDLFENGTHLTGKYCFIIELIVLKIMIEILMA